MRDNDLGKNLNQTLQEANMMLKPEGKIPFNIDYDADRELFCIIPDAVHPSGPWEDEVGTLERLKRMTPTSGESWEFHLEEAKLTGTARVAIFASDYNAFVKAVRPAKYRTPEEDQGEHPMYDRETGERWD